MRRMRIVSLNGQRGAIAVVVALMVVMLMGFTAISVDMGASWWDRKQVQNGADAGALAIAQACAAGESACDSANSVATAYAVSNKTDAAASGAALVDKPAATVSVTATTTRQHWFAPVIGIDSSDISATATAMWGPPTALGGLPLTFNKCILDSLIGAGEVPTGGTSNILLGLIDPGNSGGNGSGVAVTDPGLGDCAETTTSSGFYLAGGFGWLTTDAGECNANYDYEIGEDLLIGDSKPGRSVPKGCDQAALDALLDKTILVPIFTGTNLQGGSGGDYFIKTFAAFKLRAFDLSPSNKKLESKRVGYSPSCGKNDKDCPKQWIYGQFVRYVSLDDAARPDWNAPDEYGVYVVALIE